MVELYRMAGKVDYLLKLLGRYVADYDRVYKKLIKDVPLFDVSASFAMEWIKYETAVPCEGALHHVPRVKLSQR